MSDIVVVHLPGDGIGPEISAAVLRILASAGAPLTYVTHVAGQAALAAGESDTLPAATVDAIQEHRVALKGPCTTPIGHGFASVNVALRRGLGLFAAVRPVRSLDGVRTRFDAVDLVVVRENTEGLYSGLENRITDDVVVSMKVATREACRRVARWAFRYARQRGRRRVSLFHKANIMKLTDGMMLEEVQRLHEAEFRDLAYEPVIIDAGCMRLVKDPAQFDVILCENLYGDIVSDLAAGLVGGLGVTPGANLGDEVAVFEAVHGSAPDIAGRDLANPLALLMSATMMLNHLAETRQSDACRRAAIRIRRAYDAALADGAKTRDLGGDLGTQQFADAVIARLTA